MLSCSGQIMDEINGSKRNFIWTMNFYSLESLYDAQVVQE